MGLDRRVQIVNEIDEPSVFFRYQLCYFKTPRFNRMVLVVDTICILDRAFYRGSTYDF